MISETVEKTRGMNIGNGKL